MARTIAPRGNAAAVAEVYADLRPMIERTARSIASKYDRDPQEMIAEANLIFLEAYHTHDPSQGALDRRVGFLVSRRLRDSVRADARRERLLPRVELASDEFNHNGTGGNLKRNNSSNTIANVAVVEPPPDAFDRADVDRDASEDARMVFDIVLDGPDALAERLFTSGRRRHQASRRALTQWLMERHGWDEERVRAAFRCVKNCLDL